MTRSREVNEAQSDEGYPDDESDDENDNLTEEERNDALEKRADVIAALALCQISLNHYEIGIAYCNESIDILRDIKTNDEDAGTASTYPDVELDATTYGIGYKGSFGDNGYFKIEGSFTDYDSFSVTSGSTNTVKGDLDTTQAKFAIGYNF